MEKRKIQVGKVVVTVLALSVMLWSCSGEGGKDAQETKAASPIGIGPIKKVEVAAAVDAGMAAEGEKLFKEKCTACHKIGERYVGPDLKGVTTRRAPEWIMNMILNPVEMVQKDETAKELLATYFTQMSQQNVSEDGARKLLEYFRKMDQ